MWVSLSEFEAGNGSQIMNFALTQPFYIPEFSIVKESTGHKLGQVNVELESRNESFYLTVVA